MLSQDDKIGARQRPESLMRAFRDALEDNKLHDLGWNGEKFTWSNLHGDETFIKERLDRAIAKLACSEAYHEARV